MSRYSIYLPFRAAEVSSIGEAGLGKYCVPITVGGMIAVPPVIGRLMELHKRLDPVGIGLAQFIKAGFDPAEHKDELDRFIKDTDEMIELISEANRLRNVSTRKYVKQIEYITERLRNES